ncbi:hypothetical protein DPMN_009798 [Dreissena polymorpha]|uniref:Uncharacterized protein n=1 Tax=Dreissena polymorpha TaxID=45954 RepID=A0A9D4MYR1_DREPO|nr:hypothetical protein DPMN_009798 [Dreissena polymorpha]
MENNVINVHTPTLYTPLHSTPPSFVIENESPFTFKKKIDERSAPASENYNSCKHGYLSSENYTSCQRGCKKRRGNSFLDDAI